MVPIHWGMFDLALHTWHEPIERVYDAAKQQDVNLITPKLVQLVSLEHNNVTQDWWTEVIDNEKRN